MCSSSTGSTPTGAAIHQAVLRQSQGRLTDKNFMKEALALLSWTENYKYMMSKFGETHFDVSEIAVELMVTAPM